MRVYYRAIVASELTTENTEKTEVSNKETNDGLASGTHSMNRTASAR